MDILMENKYEFMFVLLRLSVIFTFGIFFGDKRIPAMVKFAFIFLVTMVVTPTIGYKIDGNSITKFQFMSVAFSEIIIGLTIGVVSMVIINVMQSAGSIIDMQGGFGMAQVFDPSTQSQTSLVSQFLISFGMLFFVLNDFHLTFLNLVIDSFQAIPIGSITSFTGLSDIMLEASKILISSISIGITIALPVVGVIFMVDVILGISTKTMPQLNLFSVGYIVKIMTTMILMYVYTISINFFIEKSSDFVFKALERLVS